MNKVEAGVVGSGLVVLAIVIYGFKAKKGRKYWVLTMLFLPWTGAAVGAAFGKEEEEQETSTTSQNTGSSFDSTSSSSNSNTEDDNWSVNSSSPS